MGATGTDLPFFDALFHLGLGDKSSELTEKELIEIKEALEKETDEELIINILDKFTSFSNSLFIH